MSSQTRSCQQNWPASQKTAHIDERYMNERYVNGMCEYTKTYTKTQHRDTKARCSERLCIYKDTQVLGALQDIA